MSFETDQSIRSCVISNIVTTIGFIFIFQSNWNERFINYIVFFYILGELLFSILFNIKNVQIFIINKILNADANFILKIHKKFIIEFTFSLINLVLFFIYSNIYLTTLTAVYLFIFSKGYKSIFDLYLSKIQTMTSNQLPFT